MKVVELFLGARPNIGDGTELAVNTYPRCGANAEVEVGRTDLPEIVEPRIKGSGIGNEHG